MKSTTALIILGVLTALLPFSGLPISWRSILSVIFGLSVAGIVFYHVRMARIKQQKEENAKEDNETSSA